MHKYYSLLLIVFALNIFPGKADDGDKNKKKTTHKFTVAELREIARISREDTLFVPNNLNLQLELIKTNPNLVYKFRLDSLQKSVPLTYNQYVQTYIDIFASSRKAQIGKMLGLSKYYFPIFEKALKAYNIPEEIKYLAIVESSMNPNAISRVGATGIWQFMFATAKVYGLKMDTYVDERRDPIQASYAAAAYFQDAYIEFGDWLLALAAYNCGKGNVSRAIAKAGGVKDFWEIQPYLPAETRNYVPAFIATAYIMNFHDKHDISLIEPSFLINTDTVYVNKSISLAAIAKSIDVPVQDLVNLNPAYRRKIVNGKETEPKRLVIPLTHQNVYENIYALLDGGDKGPETKAIFVNETGGSDDEKQPLKAKFHKVKPGENISVIADGYSISVQDIKVWNKLSSSMVLPGQVLAISGGPVKTYRATTKKRPSYISYKVKQGDTLSEIADKFKGLSVSELKAMNGIKRNTIQPGKILKITKS